MPEVLETLDARELQLKAGKCNIAVQDNEWIGFKMTSHGNSPVNSKVQGITKKLRTTNLNELRSFLGALNHFKKYIHDF